MPDLKELREKVEAEPVERFEVLGPTMARKHPRGNYVRYTDHAATVAKLTERAERSEKALAEEEKAHERTIAERDVSEDWADKLAHAIGGNAVGEHSNLNNPWANALEIAEATESRLSALEKDKARVVEALREAKRGMEMVHDGLADPTRPRQSIGEVAHHWLATIDAALNGEGGE